MIDSNSIKEKYASMTDIELISFANEEGHQLTSDGLLLLKEEFLSRKLDDHIIEAIEAGIVPGHAAKLKIIEEQHSNFSAEYWTYAFEQKEEGKSDLEIVNGLIERSMEEQYALLLVSGIELKAIQSLKNADAAKLTGSLIFISGIAITFLPLSMTTNRLTYIIAYCAILFGAGRFIKALYYQSKFRKIIRNIAAEKNL
jgi:multidrug transporter EmrE-like cation transporter